MGQRRDYRVKPPARWWGPPSAARWSAFRFYLLMAAIVVTVFLVFVARAARAHESGDWIRQGEFRNAVGELCCGERDCAVVEARDIKITATGYLIKSINETVPFDEATPSPNGLYWRCYWGGKRKCFFAPPPAT